MAGPGDRLAALLASPSFADALILARDLQSSKPPVPDQQVAVCRVLHRVLPAPLQPAAAAELVDLANGWLAALPGGPSPAAAAQLQAEAAQLFSTLLGGSGRTRLPPAGCRQLLLQLCSLCRQSPPQPGSVGAGELAGSCLDLLAQLPQWYPTVSKAELAAAVAALAVLLERQAAGATAVGGKPGSGVSWSGSACLLEAPAATRLLCKLLKALQVLLAEAKKDHGANAASLAASLQRCFAYGWQQPGGAPSPERSSSGCSTRAAGRYTPAAKGTVRGEEGDVGVGVGNGVAAASPSAPAGKYRPPRARSTGLMQASAGGASPGSGGIEAASAPGAAPSAAAATATADEVKPQPQPRPQLDSSDSESSDMEGSSGGGGGGRYKASRVRCGALTCLQLLAKADSKSLHGSWIALLPANNPVGSRGGVGGPQGLSIAHLLLLDPQLRVRHAAAATIATLLEGPAQRAYLAVAEAREMQRQPLRGFTTLSASLGHALVALHQGLLHSILYESEAVVAAATLRALGTLLLGAPYHRLPPQLLPSCVDAARSCLAAATPAAGPASLAAEQVPVASACLSCLAAAFSCKGLAAAALTTALLGVPGSCGGDDGGSQQLLQLLFAYAACEQPLLQLEAVMALRGVAQQHAALLTGCWAQVLTIGRAGAELPLAQVTPPQSPRTQPGGTDGTVPEKAAQQSIRLSGDFLEAAAAGKLDRGTRRPAAKSGSTVSSSPPGLTAAAATDVHAAEVHEQNAAAAAASAAASAAVAEQWQQVAAFMLRPAVRHSSPLLRAAAQAVVSALSPPACAALPPELLLQLLGWCRAAASDEASQVRSAAAKAVGALAVRPALCEMPGGATQLLAVLTAGCCDSVLAVRIPAAASLAAFCSQMATAAADAAPPAAAATTAATADAAAAAGTRLSLAAADVVPGCLRLAVAAAAGSDKVRPSSMQALGSLLSLCDSLSAADAAELPAAEERLLAGAAQALQAGLAAANSRVQWAACEAAAKLLACDTAVVHRHSTVVLPCLVAVLRECPNFRSRVLAATALQQLSEAGAAVLGSDGLIGLLDAAAAVLFQGKRCGFNVDAPAPSSALLPSQQQQQQWLPEVADLAAKAQQEAALVAAVLRVLALLPGRSADQGVVLLPPGMQGQDVSAGPALHLSGLSVLVWQARQEILREECVVGAAATATAEIQRELCDLSLVTPSMAAAAACGLELLQKRQIG